MYDLTDSKVGTDKGTQVDMFGNEHEVVIHGKTELKQGDLFQWCQDQESLKKMEGKHA